jgi:hypothetical protein
MVLALVVIALCCVLVALVALEIRDRAVRTEISVRLVGDAHLSRPAATAAAADVLNRYGYRTQAGPADTAVFARTDRSVLVWAVTIMFFPLGLLAFWAFVRVREVRVAVEDDQAGRLCTVRGTLPLPVARRAQAALERAASPAPSLVG